MSLLSSLSGAKQPDENLTRVFPPPQSEMKLEQAVPAPTEGLARTGPDMGSVLMGEQPVGEGGIVTEDRPPLKRKIGEEGETTNKVHRVGEKTGDTPPAPLPTGSALDAIRLLQDKDGKSRDLVENVLLPMVSARDAVNLGKVSTGWNKEVKEKSVVPDLQGLRRVGNEDMWTTQPATEDKRYFKPMSGVGDTPSVPHISEQKGYTSHLTDVASVNQIAHSGLDPGPYPTKVQFPVTGTGPTKIAPFSLGSADYPRKPQEGRVLAQAPPGTKQKSAEGKINTLPPDAYVETKSYSRAIRATKTEPLTPGYAVTHLTPEQATQEAAKVEQKWTGAPVDKREKL